MTVHVDLHLPPNVRVSDISSIVGILLGNEREFMTFDTGTSGAVYVPNAKIHTFVDIPEMVRITAPFKGELRYAAFHFENPIRPSCKLLTPISKPLWVAVCTRLADFYGGILDYQDCDAVTENYVVPFKNDIENAPADNDEWDIFQRRLLEIKPLTDEEIARVAHFAAYGQSQGD